MKHNVDVITQRGVCVFVCAVHADLGAVLQPAELDLVLQQPHTGTAILQALGSVVAASHIKELQKLRIDENITVMQDTMGGCERCVLGLGQGQEQWLVSQSAAGGWRRRLRVSEACC